MRLWHWLWQKRQRELDRNAQRVNSRRIEPVPEKIELPSGATITFVAPVTPNEEERVNLAIDAMASSLSRDNTR